MRYKLLKLLPKIIITIIFFGAIIFSLLFSKGIRFDSDSGQFIQTGILEVSSAPKGAIIFLDNKYIDTTPTFIRSVPLQNITVRLEKSGYYHWQKVVKISEDTVIRLKDIPLAPKDNKKIKKLASKEKVLVDPLKKGLVIVYDDLNVINIINFSDPEDEIVFFNEDIGNISFTDYGELIINGKRTGNTNIFSKIKNEPRPVEQEKSRISYKGEYLLFIRDKSLWKYNTTTEESVLIKEFSELIDGAFWFQDSFSIVVALKNKILLIDHDGENERILFQKEPGENIYFSLDMKELFWLNNDYWYKYSFE